MIVEGLSNHLTEWISTGRVDLGLVLNPEPNAAIEVTRILDEPLGLVGPRGKQGKGGTGGKSTCPSPSANWSPIP